MELKERGWRSKKYLEMFDICQQLWRVFVLIVQQRIIRTKFQYFLVTLGFLQSTKPRVRDVLKHPPHHFVSDTSNIQANSLVHLLSLQDQVRVRDLLRDRVFTRRPTGKQDFRFINQGLDWYTILQNIPGETLRFEGAITVVRGKSMEHGGFSFMWKLATKCHRTTW